MREHRPRRCDSRHDVGADRERLRSVLLVNDPLAYFAQQKRFADLAGVWQAAIVVEAM